MHALKIFATTHSAAKLFHILPAALCAADHGLYTSNLLVFSSILWQISYFCAINYNQVVSESMNCTVGTNLWPWLHGEKKEGWCAMLLIHSLHTNASENAHTWKTITSPWRVVIETSNWTLYNSERKNCFGQFIACCTIAEPPTWTSNETIPEKRQA